MSRTPAELTRRPIDWFLTGSDGESVDETVPAVLGRRIDEVREAAEPVNVRGAGAVEAAPVDSSGLDSRHESVGQQEADDEPDDLDRLFSALAHQRDEIKLRIVELDHRDQNLQVREDTLGLREELIRSRENEFERERDTSLRELEELHRSVVESGNAFMERAAALRRNRAEGSGDVHDEQHTT